MRLVLLALLTPCLLCGLEVEIASPSALLMNAETGAILFERDAEAPYYPASITKIATALYLLENKGDSLHEVAVASQEAVAAISPETKRRRDYSCPSHWLEFGGSHIGLKKGEAMSLKDLLYGLMLASGNDAANVIAEQVSGTIPQFVADLNERLRGWGCTGTTFTNPHGLHHPQHVTTARDMARIAQEALRYPTFRSVVATLSAQRPKTNLQEATQFRQYNKLLRQGAHYYPKAIGIKTGYTSDAGSTLVAAAEDDNRCLIAVVLGAKSSGQRFEDAIRLFEAGFNEKLVTRQLLRAGSQRYACRVPGGRGKLTSRLTDAVAISYYPSEEPNVRGLLVWKEGLMPPIQEGEVVGEVRIVDGNGHILTDAPLMADCHVAASFRHILARTWTASSQLRKGAKAVVIAVLGLGLVFVLRKRRI